MVLLLFKGRVMFMNIMCVNKPEKLRYFRASEQMSEAKIIQRSEFSKQKLPNPCRRHRGHSEILKTTKNCDKTRQRRFLLFSIEKWENGWKMWKIFIVWHNSILLKRICIVERRNDEILLKTDNFGGFRS